MTSSREIEQIAAAWIARRDAGAWSEHDQCQLDAWLAAATAHRVAYLRLDTAWRQSDRLRALGAGLPVGVVPPRGQWAASPPGNEVGSAWQPSRRSLTVSGHPAWRRGLPRLLAVAASLALVAWLALGLRREPPIRQIGWHTAIGELRVVPLADGSTVTLSSDSRIVVAMSRHERHIELQQGEAFFSVAKDPARPFTVEADGRRVTAVGTRFDVRRDATDVRVVVTHGLVRLQSDGEDARRQPTTLLPAGSVAVASDAGVTVSTIPLPQAEAYLNWREGFLSFHDTPLADAAAEFNRYSTRKIVVADSAVAGMRVGGNFRWSNAEGFVRLLVQAFPVKATRKGQDIVLRRR